jgi:hypothetical protein
MESPGDHHTMEFELAPGVSVQTGTFNAVIAPEELMLQALTSPALGKYLFLCLAGNRSGILPALIRRPGNIEVLRVMSPGQLAAAIRESHHTVLFVEHDPSLYDCPEETVQVAHALKIVAEEAVVVLYTPKSDPCFDLLIHRADQVYFFRAPPVPVRMTPGRGLRSRGRRETRKGQASLGGFMSRVR